MLLQLLLLSLANQLSLLLMELRSLLLGLQLLPVLLGLLLLLLLSFLPSRDSSMFLPFSPPSVGGRLPPCARTYFNVAADMYAAVLVILYNTSVSLFLVMK
jgi:hypothetical protein